MKLTTKGRYAVTAMLDLALNGKDSPTSLADIAQRQGISLAYLEQLFSRMRRQSLVDSIRGPGGGYVLARNSKDINVAEVITAVDERLDTTGCGGKGGCHGETRCLTHELWHDLSKGIHEYLSSITLQDLTDRQLHKTPSVIEFKKHQVAQK